MAPILARGAMGRDVIDFIREFGMSQIELTSASPHPHRFEFGYTRTNHTRVIRKRLDRKKRLRQYPATLQRAEVFCMKIGPYDDLPEERERIIKWLFDALFGRITTTVQAIALRIFQLGKINRLLGE
jgi:hypothetical protein